MRAATELPVHHTRGLRVPTVTTKEPSATPTGPTVSRPTQQPALPRPPLPVGAFTAARRGRAASAGGGRRAGHGPGAAVILARADPGGRQGRGRVGDSEKQAVTAGEAAAAAGAELVLVLLTRVLVRQDFSAFAKPRDRRLPCSMLALLPAAGLACGARAPDATRAAVPAHAPLQMSRPPTCHHNARARGRASGGHRRAGRLA
jgi:hypothetical protein